VLYLTIYNKALYTKKVRIKLLSPIILLIALKAIYNIISLLILGILVKIIR
jgi:hypothetical protein